MTGNRIGLHGWLLMAGLAVACDASRLRNSGRQVVAVVNGEEIEAGLLQQQLHSVQEEAQLPANSDERRRLLRGMLDQRVEQLLRLQEARQRHVRVTPAEVDQAVSRMQKDMGERFATFVRANDGTVENLRHAVEERLLLARFVEQEVEPRILVSAEEVQKYFEEHSEDFKQPERVHCLQIFSSREERMKEAVTQLRKGNDFATVARSFSEGSEAAQGGDLGTFARGQMPEAIEKGCFALRPGAQGETVRSEYGYHLFSVQAILPAGRQSLAQARDAIVARLRLDKRRQYEQDLLKELRAKAKINVRTKVLERL